MAPRDARAIYRIGVLERRICPRPRRRGSISPSRSECGDPSLPLDGGPHVEPGMGEEGKRQDRVVPRLRRPA
jgi:hypothetical protein